MKKLLTFLFVLFFVGQAYGQKRTIDVDVLSRIISAKQEELKQRVLSDLVVRNIETSNNATYNTIYYLVDIITTEKNKTVMTLDIIQQLSNYSIAYGISHHFVESYFSKTHTFEAIMPNMKAEQFIRKAIVERGLLKLGIEFPEKGEEQRVKEDYFRELTNYIIDRLYETLRKNETLTEKGFYKENLLRKYFERSKEKIDYEKEIFRYVDSHLEDYIRNLENYIREEKAFVFRYINDVKDLSELKRIKASDIKNLVKLFRESISEYREVGKDNFIAKIGDIITRYIITDLTTEEQKEFHFKLDVEAIILAFEDKFYESKLSSLRKHWIGVQPFFTLGLNYGYFTDSNSKFPLDNSNTTDLNQISLAGEKIGFKFMFHDWRYTRSFEPLEWYEYRGTYRYWSVPKEKFFLNNIHGLIYGSGLIYNITDLRSDENFDYAIVGLGVGVEFFNGLQVNVSYAMPIMPGEDIDEMWERNFINLGFDIPVFTYLKELRK